jgi:hypothetical protein
MPRHVVVDGSNLATEGRSMPSLQQLSDAVNAYIADNPTDLITVVVDATFGHRIDPKELPEFEAAIEHNELVAPPAGAVGRGDAFVLSIANKVNAVILSNDSFQEFHPDYPWLFDEGRLIGGKPVPHVGWVFVARNPVRGPVSRRATRESKAKAGGRSVDTRKASKAASLPMPVPTAPPPGAVIPEKPGRGSGRGRGRGRSVESAAPVVAASTAPSPVEAVKASAATSSKSDHVNQLLPFIHFVENHPVGTSVNAIVESYSSHGAYVTIGDVRGYVPLRLMADPAPRSAREQMKIGESVTLVVVSFAAARRSIDLAVPHLSTAAIAAAVAEAAAEAPASPAKRGSRRARSGSAEVTEATSTPTETPAAPTKRAPRKRAAEQSAADETPPTPVKKAPARRAAAPAATSAAPAETAAPAKKVARSAKKAAAAAGSAAPVEKAAPVAKAAPPKKVPAARKAAAPVEKAAPAKKAAPVKKAPAAKKAAAPVEKAAPAKKAAPVKKAAATADTPQPTPAPPAKKAAAKKAAPRAKG